MAADGTIDILEGEEARSINSRVHERYMTPAALADEEIRGVFADSDDVTLRLTPSAWRTWRAPSDLDAAFLPVER